MSVRIRFLPDDTAIDVGPGITILEAARLAGVVIESPCNGTGKCGKCLVNIASNGLEMTELDGGDPSKPGINGLVLACQTEILTETQVELVQGSGKEGLRVLETGSPVFGVEHDPFVRKIYHRALDATSIHAGDRRIAWEQGDTTQEIYGLVVDIGTTTLVATVIDISRGMELASVSALNPQSIHAQDVLSRIKLASSPDGLALMYRTVTDAINDMISRLETKARIRRDKIYEVVYSGNTCMLHLATGTNPVDLGKYPYRPALEGGEYMQAGEKALSVASCALLYLPPIISGFVGADITSGVLATRLHERKGTALLIDIGTNGEMVLIHEQGLVAASTAAGPAFEGMNITFGMRASSGAIESFTVEPEGIIILKTIDGTPARGICGSGLLDIVGELVTHGIIDRNGRLMRNPRNQTERLSPTGRDEAGPLNRECFVIRDGKPVFKITESVYLSQSDIRQVQLAKGAIRTGVEYLLRHCGIEASQVDDVLIAGAFGYHLSEKNLLATGLLPPEFSGRLTFVGNTSKTGGCAFLLNKGCREELEAVVKDVQTVELANCEGFDRTFANFLRF